MSVKRQFGHICPPGKYWYSCSTGYAGCCSMVACTSNRCDDDDLEDSSSGSSSSSPSRMSPESSTSPPAVATAHAGDGPGEDSSESSPSSSTSPPKSDSGVTHTIPNDSTVTVTRHTTITRGLSTTATDSASTFTTQAGNNSTTSSLGPPSPTQTAVGSGVPGSGINSGTVVGIAVGGVFAVALLVGLLFLWRSRRNRGLKEVETTHEPAFIDKASLHDNIFGRRPTSASLPRHPTPQQASDNGQGYGYDPFAPFGGKLGRNSYLQSIVVLNILQGELIGRRARRRLRCPTRLRWMAAASRLLNCRARR